MNEAMDVFRGRDSKEAHLKLLGDQREQSLGGLCGCEASPINRRLHVVYGILSFLLLPGLLMGCGLKKYRVKKIFNGRDQVLDHAFSPGAELVLVEYRPGKDDSFLPYELDPDPYTGFLRPPRIFSKSAISLTIPPGINPETLRLRVFIKNDPQYQNDLIEVKTIVGEIPGQLPNALVLIDDLFPPPSGKLVLYTDDFTSPYQGLRLETHDWIFLEVESPRSTQKIVFEYVQTGVRVKTSAHLLFSTGVNLLDLGVAQIEQTQGALSAFQEWTTRYPEDANDDSPLSSLMDNAWNGGAQQYNFEAVQGRVPLRRSELASAPGQIDPGGLDLAVAVSASIGYRGKDRYGPKRWLGDNFTLVFDVGVGNVGEIETILQQGTGLQERVNVLQNQLLFGAGVQLFDFVSLHFLTNPGGFIPDREGINIEAVIIPELGFDVTTALRFSSRIYERLFTSTVRRTYNEPAPIHKKSTPNKRYQPASLPAEGLPLDESYQVF